MVEISPVEHSISLEHPIKAWVSLKTYKLESPNPEL